MPCVHCIEREVSHCCCCFCYYCKLELCSHMKRPIWNSRPHWATIFSYLSNAFEQHHHSFNTVAPMDCSIVNQSYFDFHRYFRRFISLVHTTFNISGLYKTLCKSKLDFEFVHMVLNPIWYRLNFIVLQIQYFLHYSDDLYMKRKVHELEGYP